MTQIASLVLFAADVQATSEFYRAIELDLEEERHEDGRSTWPSRVGGIALVFSLHADMVNRHGG